MRAASEIRVDKVAIYIRWSTEDQSEGTTLDVQMDACKAFALSQGWSISDELVFVDDGVSGASLDRPALARLRALVLAGGVDCVVVYKLDRLSRSVVDTVKLVLDEWDARCYVKSAREPIDTLTQAGKMFFYQLMSFAEWERNVIKERTFSGKLRRAQEGKNPGIHASYGYRLGPDSMPVVEPGEAAVVHVIFRLYLSGMGCVQISRRLEEMGHPSPTGKRWSTSQLSRLLGNPVYKGTMVYGKVKFIKGKKVKNDSPHVVKENALPAIVDVATWEAVQSLKADRPTVHKPKGSGRSLSSQSLLTGLLRCRCGHSYCGNGGTGKRFTYRYYYCGGAQSKSKDFCASGRIRQDLLDEMVVKALQEQFNGEDTTARLLAHISSGLERDLLEAQTALESARREASKLQEKEARLKALFLDGKLDVDEFRELRAALNQQGADMKGQRDNAALQVKKAQLALSHRQHLTDRLSYLHRWDVLENHERKQLIRQFVHQVQAYRDKKTGEIECSIGWRWGTDRHQTETSVVYQQSRYTEACKAAFGRRQRDELGRLI